MQISLYVGLLYVVKHFFVLKCPLIFLFHLQLPLDLSTLTEAERRKRLEARKPKVKVSYKVYFISIVYVIQ